MASVQAKGKVKKKVAKPQRNFPTGPVSEGGKQRGNLPTKEFYQVVEESLTRTLGEIYPHTERSAGNSKWTYGELWADEAAKQIARNMQYGWPDDDPPLKIREREFDAPLCPDCEG